jgi:hypothetical protein
MKLVMVLILLAVWGCGDDGGTTPPPGNDAMMGDGGDDAGPDGSDDTGPEPDAGPTVMLATCEMPDEIDGDSAGIDTTGGRPGLLPLGQDCGSEAAPSAPQHVFSYTVPGEGLVGVTVNAATEGTDDDFDTVIEVRRGNCRTPDSQRCFDDASMSDFRSAGEFAAMGGEEVFIIVTGFTNSEVGEHEGLVEIELSTRAVNAPVITAGEARNFGKRLEFRVSGTDADSDPLGLLVTLLDADDQPVDLNGNGMAGDDALVPALQSDIAEMDEYSFVALRRQGFGEDLAMMIDDLGVTKARLVMVDALFLSSEPFDVDLVEFTDAFLGDECTGETTVCFAGLECNDGGTCDATEAATTACDGATAIAIEMPPTTEPFTHVATGTLEPGAGEPGFEAPCSTTPGKEALYTIEVPALPAPVVGYDLEVRTDAGDSTTEDDTVIHLRNECVDPRDLELCGDDITPPMGSMDFDLRSLVLASEIEPGTWTIVVEQWGAPMTALEYDLSVKLTPVLEAGTACDPAGEDNRCITGACPAGESVCPPAS